MRPIRIAVDQRCCFFGATRSGKTTLAKGLLSSVARYVVIDQKYRFTDGSPILTAYNPRKERQIIRIPPSRDEQADIDDCLDSIWRGPPTLVFVDELALVNPSRTVLRPTLSRLIRQGGESGFGVWCGSQRPKDLPSAVFTESEHFFLFRLRWRADREKVLDFTDERLAELLPRLRHHQCVYFGYEPDGERMEWLAPQLVQNGSR